MTNEEAKERVWDLIGDDERTAQLAIELEDKHSYPVPGEVKGMPKARRYKIDYRAVLRDLQETHKKEN